MNNSSPKKLNIIAIVVTYYPDSIGLEKQVQILSTQCDRVEVIDNTPTIANLALKSLEKFSNFSSISLGTNFGIAYAQNIGIQKAVDKGADYVLLMDQDSIPEAGMVEKLLTTFGSDSSSNIIAAGPSYIDPRSKIKSYFMVSKLGFPFRYKPNKKIEPLIAVNVTFLISSGTLISIPKLLRVGGMRSNYFIDHVDTEWCLRALSKGFSLVGLHSAIMEHSLGDKVKRFWLIYLRSVAYHSPLRDYYMFRNTILMLRDTKIPILWASFLSLRLLQFAAYFLIFAGDRSMRLKAMLLGLKHGLLRIDGKVNLETGICTPIPKTHLDPT
jgi:rhamnosyltransferase